MAVLLSARVKVCCATSVPVPPVMHNAGLCLLSAWQTVTNQLSPVISVMSLSCLKNATLPNGARNRASYENRDWRMKSTIMWDGESYKKITTDGLTMGDEYTWMFGERNEANGFINNDASNQTGYIFRKFMDESDNINYVDIESTSYWIEMRYAEIILILSEAYARLDKFKEAYDYLNKIRTRVGLLS